MGGPDVTGREPGGGVLLERDRELAALAAAIERSSSGAGGVMVIEGPAGIGKTRLLSAGAALAGERGMGVLSARGGEFEREFAYGVVRQLLEPALAGTSAARRATLLAGPAGHAAALLDLVAPSGRRSREDSAPAPPALSGDVSPEILHGLYWLVVALAEPDGLLLVFDDAHWFDAPSRRFIAYLAHRLEELPLLAILALRTGEPDGTGTLLAGLDTGGNAELLTLSPLSERGTGKLVRRDLSTEAEPVFCSACHRATAGNPFLLGELVAQLRGDGVEPSASNAEQVGGLRPASVTRSVLARLARVGADATKLARAVAVLGTGAELRWAQRLAGLDPRAGADAVDALVAADVLSFGATLEYVHPLALSAVYESMPSAGRALAHADAARLLWREGAGVERVAAQLLHAAPAGDCEAVESLCAAAALASRRGAPAVQVTYLLRALAEPPAAEQRAAITLALGRAQALTSDSGCLQTLQRARAISDGAREGSVVALELGRAMMMFDRSADAFDLWAGARAELGDSDPALSALLEAEEVGAALLDVSTAPRAIARLAQPTRLAGADSLGGRLLLAYGAYLGGARGVAAVETARAAQRALRGGDLLSDQTLIAWSFAVATLTISDRFDSALEHTDAALAAARESGSLPMFQLASWLRAWAQYRRGALAEAEADAQGALDAAAETWFTAPVGFVVDVLLERGELAEAARLFDAYGPNTELFPNLLLANFLLDSRARLRCAQGHWGDGLGDLLAVGARLAAWQTTNPALFAWRSSAALAHLALGEHDQARRLAAEEVELARSFAAPRALGVALRAVGLVEGGERGLELLAEAVTVLEDSSAELALALALTDYGAALRRHGLRVAALEPLRRGLDLADRCGASVLTRRAREELLAAGARPRRERIAGSQALTASERRVATLAAEGLTNKEIAQALFITIKTVKAHLGHSFGKLDIATRGQLADALSD